MKSSVFARLYKGQAHKVLLPEKQRFLDEHTRWIDKMWNEVKQCDPD
jgi:hypothetical protein